MMGILTDLMRRLQGISATQLCIILFGLLIGSGLIQFSSYGIAWDEHSQREIGTVSYQFIAHGDRKIDTYRDRDYGVGFELPLIALEKILHLEDTREVYLIRHLATFLFFTLCLLFGYWLIVDLFGNPWLATAGVLMIALHPLLNGHAFFNSKDIPFMGMYLICFFALNRAFSRQSLNYFALTGISLGILINLRIMGFMLLLIVLGFIAIDAFSRRGGWRNQFVNGLVLLLSFWTALYFSWPYLYDNAFENLANAFSNMSRFRFNRETLFLGTYIKPSEIPWHYGPVWMSITTPLIFLILGGIGLVISSFYVLRNFSQIFSPSITRNLTIYVLCFTTPLAAVVVFNSVLYDGWRHLFFVYPPFVLLGVFALHLLRDMRKMTLIFGIAVSAGIIASTVHIAYYHPHGHVFFNYIVDRNSPNHERKLFETDYWGVSYRQGLESVLTGDKRDEVSIQMGNPPGEYNLEILRTEDRQRVQLTDQSPDYIVTDYRWHPHDLKFDNYERIDSIVVLENCLLSVFKKNQTD